MPIRKTINKTFIATAIAAAISTQAQALEVYQSDATTVTITGWLVMQAIHDDEGTLLDNGTSRIGEIVEHKVNDDLSILGRMEWRVNTLNNNDVTSITADNSAEYTSDQSQVFNNRLGYLGINSKDYGSLTVGKQWSPYYSVTGATDWYYTGGGWSSGTYDFGDGGLGGTGRSDDAVVWTNNYDVMGGHVRVGAQYQLSRHDIEIDTHYLTGSVTLEGGYGGSVVYTMDNGLSLGVAYTESDLENSSLIDSVGNPESLANNRSIASSLVYTTDRWYIGATYADTSGRSTTNEGTIVPMHGSEFIAIYQLDDVDYGWAMRFGYNHNTPTNDADAKYQDYDLMYSYLGFNYSFDDTNTVYIETQIDSGTDLDTTNGLISTKDSKDNYVAIGLLLTF